MLAPGDIAEIPPFKSRLPTPEARPPRLPSPAPAPAPPSQLATTEFALRSSPPELGGKNGRHATYEWPSGDAYDGWAVDGKRQGRGTYTFAGGATLDCDWKDDAPGGRGVFTAPRTVYKGPFRANKFHGKGVLKVAGNTYRGAFRAGVFHGSGTLAFASGDRYEGAFRHHRFHGKGAYVWKSGQRYEGLFDGGAMTGRGVTQWPEGQPFDQDADHGEGGHRQHHADPVVQVQPGHGGKGDIGAQHIEMPVGEVRDLHRSVDQCHAKGHKAVDTAQDQTIHDLLGKQLHRAHPSQGVPGRPRVVAAAWRAHVFPALRWPGAKHAGHLSRKLSDGFSSRSNV